MVRNPINKAQRIPLNDIVFESSGESSHSKMIQKISLLVVAAAAVSGQTAEGPASARTLLGNYCQGCHNETNRSGGVSVEGLNPASVHESGMTWEKVLRKVRTGEMPPPGLPRPKAAASEGFVNWLEGELDRSAAARRNPGSPSVHRLNRAEYSNAIRDLLGLRMDHAATLPADDSGYGFDNIGSVLTVSPLLMEKYMSTARRVSRLAVGTVKTGAAVERFNPGRGQALDASDDLPLNLRSTVLVNYHFPVDAEYSITVRVRGNPPPNSPPAKLEVRIDGQRVKLHDVVFSTAEEAQITRNFEIRLPVKAGLHAVSAGYLNETLKPETGVVSRRGFGPPPVFTNVALEYMLIGGPFHPTGPGDTESRRIIFQCRPASGEKEEPCAQRILTTLARRAYRRLPLAGRTAGPSTQALRRPCARCWCRRTFCSAWSGTPRPPRQAPRGVCRISNWHRGCRSSFGAVSRTRNCCGWPSRTNCAPRFRNRCGACWPTRSLVR